MWSSSSRYYEEKEPPCEKQVIVSHAKILSHVAFVP